VAGRLTSVAAPTADWRVDALALAPDPGELRPAASLRPVPDRGAGAATRLASALDEPQSHFLGLLNRFPLDEQRRYLVVGGLDMFYDHPLTGVGFGGFQHNLLGAYAYDIKPGYHDTLSHNSFVTVLAEQGLLGFAMLIAAIVAVVREVRRLTARARRPWISVSVPAVLLGLILFDSLFEGRLFTEPYLWLMLGLLYSASRSMPPSGSSHDASTAEHISEEP
jgi:O-antigen ligase